MKRVKLDQTKDLPAEGKGKVLLLQDGREIAIFKREGKLYAIDNICPHEGGPLGDGVFEEDIVTCPWHGWQFDVKTGACQNLCGENVCCYPVEVENGEIFLRLE